MSTPCRLYSGVWAMVHYAVNCFASTILVPSLAKKWRGSKNFLLASFAEFVPHFRNRGAAPESRESGVTARQVGLNIFRCWNSLDSHIGFRCLILPHIIQLYNQTNPGHPGFNHCTDRFTASMHI